MLFEDYLIELPRKELFTGIQEIHVNNVRAVLRSFVQYVHRLFKEGSGSIRVV